MVTSPRPLYGETGLPYLPRQRHRLANAILCRSTLHTLHHGAFIKEILV